MTIKYTEQFNKLWHIYDNALAHGKKGSKFSALKAFEKNTEEEQDRIIFDTQALIRHFKQQVQPDRLPHLSTWLNQRYHEQEIPSVTEKVIENLSNCTIEGCLMPVHGSAFKYCAMHIPCQHDEQLREAWKSTGLNRKSHSLAQDCREYIKSKGYSI